MKVWASGPEAQPGFGPAAGDVLRVGSVQHIACLGMHALRQHVAEDEGAGRRAEEAIALGIAQRPEAVIRRDALQHRVLVEIAVGYPRWYVQRSSARVTPGQCAIAVTMLWLRSRREADRDVVPAEVFERAVQDGVDAVLERSRDHHQRDAARYARRTAERAHRTAHQAAQRHSQRQWQAPTEEARGLRGKLAAHGIGWQDARCLARRAERAEQTGRLRELEQRREQVLRS